ncbi:tRNA (adenosine(37)-N6)-threonylcarbamoyltransferase complex ATPase subunit type 1 TsaE, partial [Thermodesulfovibrionales bacterium]|nr:tRNA (adenosine(37)-N6)-threonylcarbamoyltransferase complex ATPase subunit type 1 TsaE [Thermodesulfovibrionales bacterium]MCL0069040.1 tRNA (adenosine(37)-N6)-threonylcarbamoyltransferase complex ATPase subunit type 1 TsaE [Thermodesulfovibrionales bacterium]
SIIVNSRRWNMKKIITASPEGTEGWGFKIGESLKIKEAGIVFLYGDLGAGKTVFIKGIASALNIPKRDVGSASFVIVAEYETSPPFHHIDLYRLERDDDIEALGIWEYIDSDGITVVEWAERLSEVPEEILKEAIKVRISHCNENSREIIIEGVPDSLFA